jgi:hypothetical protein
MPTEVQSPVTRKGSKVSGNIPGLSPGAFSNPSRGRTDSLPHQPSHARVSRNAEEPAEVRVTGPESDSPIAGFKTAVREFLK